MTDPETIATYEAVAHEYGERHGDRSAVAEIVDAFLDALEDATDAAETANAGAGEGEAAARSAGHGEATAQSPARVLDVGCGPGWESATFAAAGYSVLGVDLATRFLEAAETETAPAADFARMDMRHLGLTSGAFDGLWACASFLHVPREEAPETLAGFHRVLRAGGVLALAVKRGEGTRAGDGYEGDRREFVLYEPDGLRELVTEAGFSVTRLDADQDWIFLLGTA